MSFLPSFPNTHLNTLELKHNGDCNLLGEGENKVIFAEEVYGEDGWVAQHELSIGGEFAHSVDEDGGAAETLQPLTLPEHIVTPKTGWQTMMLNFAGPRHRGLRAPERVIDVVRPLALTEKIALIDKLKLRMLPPSILGIAESYVLSESLIIRPNVYFVCRRIRIAYALSDVRLDANNQPYDYDTLLLYMAHFYDCAQEPSILDLLTNLTTVPLQRPMDCLLADNHLYIADGGGDDRLNAIHVWQLDLPEALSEEEKLQKKLYG
jgi:hypothetical protein